MSDTTDDVVVPPAVLVPTADYETLVQTVTARVATVVRHEPGRDAEQLDLAVRTAIEAVAAYLDRLTSYASIATLEWSIVAALVQYAAVEFKRPGFALGTAGYEPADVDALRAQGAILATIAPYKRRIGVA